MHKTIRVHTNDPKNEIIQLKLSGKVEKFATFEPKQVRLTGRVGETVTQSVEIIPETEKPWNIVKVTPNKGQYYSYSLKDIEVKGKKAYELSFTNLQETPGLYYDKVVITTDREDHKPLNIIVVGEISEAKTPDPEKK